MTLPIVNNNQHENQLQPLKEKQPSSIQKLLSLYTHRQDRSLSLQNSFNESKPILYNKAINQWNSRTFAKSQRKQTVRTIYLNKLSQKLNKNSQKPVNINFEYSELKDLMQQRINDISLKKDYEKFINLLTDQQLVDRLQDELKYLPKPLRSYRSNNQKNKKNAKKEQIIQIRGNRMKQQDEIPQNYRYHKNFSYYDSKFMNNDGENGLSFMKNKRRSDGDIIKKKRKHHKIQQEDIPITGWG